MLTRRKLRTDRPDDPWHQHCETLIEAKGRAATIYDADNRAAWQSIDDTGTGQRWVRHDGELEWRPPIPTIHTTYAPSGSPSSKFCDSPERARTTRHR